MTDELPYVSVDPDNDGYMKITISDNGYQAWTLRILTEEKAAILMSELYRFRIPGIATSLERAAYLRGLQRAVEVAKDKHESGIHGSHEVSLQIIAALEAEIAKGGPDAG